MTEELWTFDTQTSLWSQITQLTTNSNWPAATREHSGVMDVNGFMWVFGGKHWYGRTDELWKLAPKYLPYVMGTHIAASVFIFVWWYRWQPDDGLPRIPTTLQTRLGKPETE
mmetsp:Transcript_3639/g.6544  ORF Transcript_3639/g.6544 Transcript_3639/m.6544 type:complete len:112 (+) Transcript_3639:2-337(+)